MRDYVEALKTLAFAYENTLSIPSSTAILVNKSEIQGET